MRLMLLVAWLTAALISLPQFAVWRSFQAFESPPWSQCMQMWEIQRAVAQRDAATAAAASTTTLMHEESIYVIAHMMLIFWVPAFIILLCYVLLSCWVYVNSKPSLFELTTAGKGGAGGVGIECAGAAHAAGDAPVRAAIAAEMSEMNRCPRVSYQQITTMTALNDPSSDKPTIVINGQRAVSPTNMMNSSPTLINGVQQQQHQEQQQQQQQRNSSNTAKSNRNRAIRVSFLLVVGYFACWLPYNFLALIQFVDPELFSRHANKVYFLHGMIVFNSVINPYLYGLCGGLCRQRRRDS
uniref:G_PROTEIN_RECEP_F1_2 domain-containing protein n=1 Tax=Globodera pallida TaxID=36090 RepID=A0A183BR65_GLOPA